MRRIVVSAPSAFAEFAQGGDGDVRSRPAIYKLIRTLEEAGILTSMGKAGRAELWYAPELHQVLAPA